MAVRATGFEQGPIRPPSEAASLLVRLTRNCPWNRCLFCPVYKGETFSRRSPEEIRQDIEVIADAADLFVERSRRLGHGGSITREILEFARSSCPQLFSVAVWLYRGGGAVFLQDGDSLLLPTAELVDILELLYRRLPGIKRVTTYARSRTLLRKSVSELVRLKEAGLSRIHVGLESGYDPLLSLMQKGVTGAQHREAGLLVKGSGISLSEYVILGLGGTAMWREHALATAEVLSAVNPDFIRVRTLAVHPASPLFKKMEQGEFKPLDDEGILKEEALLLENLSGITSRFYSDHILNLLEEVAGRFPEDASAMRGVIERYFSLPPAERERFRLGRRTGVYRFLDDRSDASLSAEVERLYLRLKKEGLSVDDYTRQVMLGYL